MQAWHLRPVFLHIDPSRVGSFVGKSGVAVMDIIGSTRSLPSLRGIRIADPQLPQATLIRLA